MSEAAGVGGTTAARYVGARVQRLEDPRLLAGRGSYIDDHAMPGMLHAAFVRSSLAHAEVASVDVNRARSVPGVSAVLTGTDVVSRAKPIT